MKRIIQGGLEAILVVSMMAGCARAVEKKTPTATEVPTAIPTETIEPTPTYDFQADIDQLTQQEWGEPFIGGRMGSWRLPVPLIEYLNDNPNLQDKVIIEVTRYYEEETISTEVSYDQIDGHDRHPLMMGGARDVVTVRYEYEDHSAIILQHEHVEPDRIVEMVYGLDGLTTRRIYEGKHYFEGEKLILGLIFEMGNEKSKVPFVIDGKSITAIEAGGYLSNTPRMVPAPEANPLTAEPGETKFYVVDPTGEGNYRCAFALHNPTPEE